MSFPLRLFLVLVTTRYCLSKRRIRSLFFWLLQLLFCFFSCLLVLLFLCPFVLRYNLSIEFFPKFLCDRITDILIHCLPLLIDLLCLVRGHKQAIGNQISITMNSGDDATDDLMKAIIEALNKYIFMLAERQIRLAFEQSEKEVEDLHQRTKEGMETARLNGKRIGQPKGAKLVTKKSVEAKEQIMKYSKDFQGTLDDVECMKLVGVARGTYYKYKRELKADNNL